jgi:AcrR family transcriptional regulator
VNDDGATRQRVLQAGEELFARHGFKKVTVRDICRAAGANVAAVNYHFGDKIGLYREVMQGAIDAMRGTSEAARAAGEGQPAEEKLRRYIAIFLRRLLRPGRATVHQLINREMADPTPALDRLVEEGVRPRVEYLAGIVAEIMGLHRGDERVLRCAASVQAQALSYVPNPIATRLGFHFEGTPEEIEAAVRHVSLFSLAGVRAVGRESRARPSGAGARPRRSRRRAARPRGGRRGTGPSGAGRR